MTKGIFPHATTRENMIATMGVYAGEMYGRDMIELPEGIEGEDIFANFAVVAVDTYMALKDLGINDMMFVEFCERTLRLVFKKGERNYEPYR